MSPPQQLTRDTMIGPFPLPPVDEELRAEAQQKPGEWIAFVDPTVQPGVSPPEYAVQGGYYADEHGQLSSYYLNPDYAPSPARAGFRVNNGFELTLWRVLNGYNPAGLLADAELLAYAEEDGDTRLPLICDPESPELSVVPVCSSPSFAPWEHTHPVPGHMVLELTGDSDVVVDINPGSAVLSLRLAARQLAGLINAETPHLKDRVRQA